MNKKIVEINGVNVEVDMSTVKVIENYKVGDSIKVLIKDYSSYTSYPGVIVGFDDFEMLPTIIIAYIEQKYNEATIKFVYFNSNIENTEICPCNKHDISLDSPDIIGSFDRQIEELETKLRDVKNRKSFFINHFNEHFKGEKNESN